MATATRIASLSCLVLLAFTTAGCAENSAGPEERLREWLEAIDAAAEAKDRRDIIDRISPAYSDARGNTRDDINKLLRLNFLRSNRVEFVPVVESIDVIGGTAAEISLRVGMAGTTTGRFGLRADAYRFELELEEHDGEWLLISARWGELGQALR
ncbi:MAG: hypothetical protein HKN77_04920 [Woeseiaceae bacterium]|nr:hypothetical protein [Woeseiaceae bacterium]